MHQRFLLHIVLFSLLLFFVPPLLAQDKNFTIVIDAGHGGRDPGAVGVTAKEKDINLAVALKLGKLISSNHKDVKVVYTRDKDVFVDLDERADIANKNKADLFMSIHVNAVSRRGSTVEGTETYTLGLARTEENLEVAKRENAAILLEDDYMQKYEGFDPNSTESYIIFELMQNKHMEQSISLASEIQKSFVGAKREDRGVRQAGFLVLRKTSMPSVLVELGYISNRNEERFLSSNQGQNQLSAALYNAFEKFKREYNRKQGGALAGSTVQTQTPPPPQEEVIIPETTPTQEKKTTPVANPKINETVTVTTPQKQPTPEEAVIYRIQIFTSGEKLNEDSRHFKGYKNVSYYVENGIYKYTYGETSDPNEIKILREKVSKDFKDAFVIAIKNGKKVKN
ncbi:N-acetylmuramoyl-L-alanine amidase [Parabacteroides sp. PF5-9]|uniref:N-acetylmuramoyl-L-alanine amidase family protein n=1 Tax=Parabacteroides sp. PF5-9 TaxID=1742404 RepID=UPI0024752FAA|nr:N-acetylmuramoyl-L-alanine amidase [Parabacteroides sp. PF5-9]MDH6358270.1 N-acetylmuramoyl-L-alanine amidase [Parabacteroides sp. PF5-9]